MKYQEKNPDDIWYFIKQLPNTGTGRKHLKHFLDDITRHYVEKQTLEISRRILWDIYDFCLGLKEYAQGEKVPYRLHLNASWARDLGKE